MEGKTIEASQLLTWVQGLIGFMSHYGYVEAEVQFLTWIGQKHDRFDGTAILEYIAREQS